MKKIFTLLLIFIMALSLFTACSQDPAAENDAAGEETPATVSEIIDIAALNGPTGMGMVQLMDMGDKYSITSYQAPTDVTAKIINGDVDVAAVPSNLAAVLYNKTEGEVVAVSPLVLGMLQILGNDAGVEEVADLAGKTIIAASAGEPLT